MIALYVRLAEIGSGKDVVRIIRHSRLPPEAAWANLQSAWGKTALTFQPATFLPTREQGTRMRDRPGKVAPYRDIARPNPGHLLQTGTKFANNFRKIRLHYP